MFLPYMRYISEQRAIKQNNVMIRVQLNEF